MAAAPRWAQACFLLLLQAILLGLPSLQPCTADYDYVMYAIKEKQDVLYPGQSLQYSSLKYGDYYKFEMQEDCDLVLSDSGKTIWHTHTANAGRGCRATLTNEGVLVVSSESGNKVWSSGKPNGVGFYVLVLQRDRNLVIYDKVVWATGTNGNPAVNKEKSDYVMYATKTNQEVLYSGEYLAYGSFKFEMQEDCNLVLYDSGKTIWQTYTTDAGTGCRATLTNEGVLVVSDEWGNKVWSSGKPNGVGFYVLVLQRDRNVVIYSKPVFATGTNKPGATLNKGKSANVTSEVTEEATGLGRKMIHMVVNNLE